MKATLFVTLFASLAIAMPTVIQLDGSDNANSTDIITPGNNAESEITASGKASLVARAETAYIDHTRRFQPEKREDKDKKKDKKKKEKEAKKKEKEEKKKKEKQQQQGAQGGNNSTQGKTSSSYLI